MAHSDIKLTLWSWSPYSSMIRKQYLHSEPELKITWNLHYRLQCTSPSPSTFKNYTEIKLELSILFKQVATTWWVICILGFVGHRILEERKSYFPTKLSNTLLFPALWHPITTIWGKEMSRVWPLATNLFCSSFTTSIKSISSGLAAKKNLKLEYNIFFRKTIL